MLRTIPRVLSAEEQTKIMHWFQHRIRSSRCCAKPALFGTPFGNPNGLHATEYMQVQMAMRYYQHAKMLSVGLSRLLHANSESAHHSGASIVSPGHRRIAGLLWLCESMQAHHMYWADRKEEHGPMRFRQYLKQTPAKML